MCCRQCGVCLHCTQIMRVTSAGEVCDMSPHQSVRACVNCSGIQYSMSVLSSSRKYLLWFSQILAFHLGSVLSIKKNVYLN